VRASSRLKLLPDEGSKKAPEPESLWLENLATELSQCTWSNLSGAHRSRGQLQLGKASTTFQIAATIHRASVVAGAPKVWIAEYDDLDPPSGVADLEIWFVKGGDHPQGFGWRIRAERLLPPTRRVPPRYTRLRPLTAEAAGPASGALSAALPPGLAPLYWFYNFNVGDTDSGRCPFCHHRRDASDACHPDEKWALGITVATAATIQTLMGSKSASARLSYSAVRRLSIPLECFLSVPAEVQNEHVTFLESLRSWNYRVRASPNRLATPPSYVSRLAGLTPDSTEGVRSLPERPHSRVLVVIQSDPE
jgi:hypothetical protein